MSSNKFFRRIADDFRHKELLPLKMLFFVHASSEYSPYSVGIRLFCLLGLTSHIVPQRCWCCTPT